MRSKTIIAVALAAFMSVGYAAMPAQFSPAVSVSAVAKLTAPTGITYTSTTNSVTLKWDKVNGADAYRIYKYDTAKKQFVKYKTVSGTTCSVDALKLDASYKLRIASLDKIEGKYVEGGHKDITVKTSKESQRKSIPTFPDTLKKYGFSDQIDTSKSITNMLYWKRGTAELGIDRRTGADLSYELERASDAKKAFESDFKKTGYTLKEIEDNSTDGMTEFKYEVYYDGDHVANFRYFFEYSSSTNSNTIKFYTSYTFSYNSSKYTME